MKRLIFILAVIVNTNVYSQFTSGSYIYIAPRITLGYTFGAGLNYGIDLGTGLYKFSYDELYINAGISFSLSFSNVYQTTHIINTVNFMLENEYANFRIGGGIIYNRWGFRNVNKNKSPGFNLDMSIGYPDSRTPKIGYRYFSPNINKWYEFKGNKYKIIYIYFRHTDFVIKE